MNKAQIQALIDSTIAGQGNQVDSGGALAKILTEINNAAFAGANVQSDWDESDNTDPSFIKNKPTIPAAQVQSDWDEADTDNPAFIKNKPTIPAAQVQSDWNQVDNVAADFIKNKPTIPAASLLVEGAADSSGASFAPNEGQPNLANAVAAYKAGREVILKYIYEDDESDVHYANIVGLAPSSGQEGLIYLKNYDPETGSVTYDIWL